MMLAKLREEPLLMPRKMDRHMGIHTWESETYLDSLQLREHCVAQSLYFHLRRAIAGGGQHTESL